MVYMHIIERRFNNGRSGIQTSAAPTNTTIFLPPPRPPLPRTAGPPHTPAAPPPALPPTPSAPMSAAAAAFGPRAARPPVAVASVVAPPACCCYCYCCCPLPLLLLVLLPCRSVRLVSYVRAVCVLAAASAAIDPCSANRPRPIGCFCLSPVMVCLMDGKGGLAFIYVDRGVLVRC